MMAQVIGLDKVLESIRAETPKGRKKMAVNVGYSAPYAIYVHENLLCNHPNGGQAKFLEQPARLHREALIAIIAKALKNKEGLTLGLFKAAQFLLARSKELVPVDTGFLRDSGFIEIFNL